MTQPRLLDVPTSEVGYTSAIAEGEGRRPRSLRGHVVALEKKTRRRLIYSVLRGQQNELADMTIFNVSSCIFQFNNR